MVHGTRQSATGPATISQRSQGERGNAARAVRSGVFSALGTVGSFLLLNLVVVAASLPIVTLPLVADGLFVAFEAGRSRGENRYAQVMLGALRSGPRWRTTKVNGVPMLCLSVTAAEVFFLADRGSGEARVPLALGLVGLLVCCVTLPYVVLINAERPERGVLETWELALAMGVRNIWVTGPLFCLEFALLAVTLWTDPLLFLPGLAAGYAYLVYVTARLGLRRDRGQLDA